MKDFLGNELKVGDEVVVVDYEGCSFETAVVSRINNDSSAILDWIPGTFCNTELIKVIKVIKE